MEKSNPNYIHDCGGTKEKITLSYKALSDMGFSSDELIKIIDFYLFKAPIIKNNESAAGGLKSLSDFGWKGSSGPSSLSKLEGLLLKESGISSFCMIRSDSIDETLKSMDLLSDSICSTHPRAVMKQNYLLKVNEAGAISLTARENRMVALFRHIRNSIAHGCTYAFSNGLIMLEDKDENSSKITCRMILKKDTLIKWIEIINSKSSEV